MTSIILAITILTAGVNGVEDVNAIRKGVKVVHHHFTRPVYRHVIKPIAKGGKNAVVKLSGSQH
jgi:hypothetical protein